MTKVSVITSLYPGDTDTLAKKGLEQQSNRDFEYLVESSKEPLSVVRNRLAREADGEILAFLDGDAKPNPRWIERIIDAYEDGKLAVGGPAEPLWDDEAVQKNVPFGWIWIVGAGPYPGEDQTYVRNTYGCNFTIKTDVFEDLGGFNENLGKGAKIPHGEETDLAKRMYDEYDERMWYDRSIYVEHYVSPEQTKRSYMLKRSFEQGYTKAVVGFESEEAQVVKNVAKSKSPWEFALLAVGGIGFIVGAITGEEI